MDVEKSQGVLLSVFRHCENIFLKIFLSKGSPFNFFDILQQIGCLKIPKAPFQFFSVLRDFCSENLFPQLVPPSIFLLFCDRMDVEKSQRVPFSFFRHCEIFFRKFVFSPKGRPFNCDKNVDNFGSVPFSAPQGLALPGPGVPLGPFFGFSIFEYCKLTLGSHFAIFEPWILPRLGPVPACFFFLGLESRTVGPIDPRKLKLILGFMRIFELFLVGAS